MTSRTVSQIKQRRRFAVAGSVTVPFAGAGTVNIILSNSTDAITISVPASAANSIFVKDDLLGTPAGVEIQPGNSQRMQIGGSNTPSALNLAFFNSGGANITCTYLEERYV